VGEGMKLEPGCLFSLLYVGDEMKKFRVCDCLSPLPHAGEGQGRGF
jgi:hypothetical protein